MQKLSLARKSTAHHYFRFAFIFLFDWKKPKKTHLANFTQARFYTKSWKSKAVLCYTVM